MLQEMHYLDDMQVEQEGMTEEQEMHLKWVLFAKVPISEEQEARHAEESLFK